MSKTIHHDNFNKGFYDDYVQCKVTTDYFIMKQLLLIISEITEAVEILRKEDIDFNLEPRIPNTLNREEGIKFFEDNFKDKFQDEIGDTFIRLFDLCGFLGINIEDWISAKLEYNKSREHKHGKRY